jgi:hypothetical protein
MYYVVTCFVYNILGTLLVNERMLESYVIARDRFLVPGGKMFPTTGRLSSGSSITFLVLILHLCMVQHSRGIFHSLWWMHSIQDYWFLRLRFIRLISLP